MASALISSLKTVSGNQPQIARIIEEATQTLLGGTPVMVNPADGGVQAWDGVTVSEGIAGFSKEPGSSLATTGTALTLTFGSVPFETLAANIPRGAPLNDGKIGFEVANDDTIFFGQVGPLQTTAATDITMAYGLTIDTDNHWYVDKTKIAAAAVVTIVELDYVDTTRGVHFQVLTSAQQL